MSREGLFYYEILRSCEALASLTEAELRHLAAHASQMFLPPESVLFNKDDHAAVVYVISTGKVEFRDIEGAEPDVKRAAISGALIGDVSLFPEEAQQRRAKAVVLMDSIILMIPVTAFTEGIMAKLQPYLAACRHQYHPQGEE